MKRLKCEIPVTLMERAIAFERLLAEKFEEYSFSWEHYEEYEDADTDYQAVFVPMNKDMAYTIVLSEQDAGIYAYGIANRWHFENADTYSFQDMLLKTSEYSHMNLCVWEEEDEGISINGKYILPEWSEEIFTAEGYAKMVYKALVHFIEEASSFNELFEKWN